MRSFLQSRHGSQKVKFDQGRGSQPYEKCTSHESGRRCKDQ